MKPATRIAAFFCLVCGHGFAGTWPGFLVDSNCYRNEERNINPTDTVPADRDRGDEVRYCRPNAKTKSFAFVDRDGRSFKLDAAGDAEAAKLVPAGGKQGLFSVSVTGEKNGNTIQVDSISLGK